MSSVREHQESRSISTSGGRGIGSRAFLCEGYGSAADVLALIGTTVGSVAIPDKGDSHPEFPGLVATDFSISPIADSRSGSSALSWQITFQYEVISVAFVSPMDPIVQTLPNELGYVEMTSSIRAEFYSAWRLNPNIPATGEPSTDDIQGTPIDRAGNPVSIQRNIQEMTISEIVNSPNISTYRRFRFSRNSAPFEGAVVGSVLYKGADISRVGIDVYRVAHHFVEDQYLHLQQWPAVDGDGEAFDNDPANGHADSVYHYQQFTNLYDFNLISGNF